MYITFCCIEYYQNQCQQYQLQSYILLSVVLNIINTSVNSIWYNQVYYNAMVMLDDQYRNQKKKIMFDIILSSFLAKKKTEKNGKNTVCQESEIIIRILQPVSSLAIQNNICFWTSSSSLALALGERIKNHFSYKSSSSLALAQSERIKNSLQLQKSASWCLNRTANRCYI